MTIDAKIILVGRENSGKTCLIKRYVHGAYTETPSTIGVAFSASTVNVNGQIVTAGIWDSAGSERFLSMTRQYYRNADVAIVCYDVNSLESFQRVIFWINEVKTNEPQCMLILCGTKKDKGGKIPERYIDELKLTHDIYACFETSAKTGDAIDDVFYSAVEAWFTRRPPGGKESLRLEPKQNYPTCC